MIQKAIKSLKMKNKPLKFKNPKLPKVAKKVAESDSDISEPDVSGNAPKMDKKALKQISTEVTDLLASLKKEHGMEDESEAPSKLVKKEKNLDKANKVNVDLKKVKKEKPGKKLPTANDKVPKLVKIEKGIKKEKDTSGALPPQNQPQENSPKKKNKKNKKRAAVDAEANNDEPQAKKVKENPNKKPKQKVKQAAIKNEVANEETEESFENAKIAEADDVKKNHYLKDATPVYVGNLPTNIKRVKLVKLLKKYGKILSIRFRTNTGKSFYKKSQIEKVPHLIAFVYFDSREAAEASVQSNGEQLGDNVITVDIDYKDKSAQIKPQNTVVIGNLKYAVTDNILRDAFKCCGEIENVRTVQALKGCAGVAFIRFAKPESVALALKLNGTSILDREVRVEKYKQNYSEKKAKKEKTQKLQNVGKNKKNPDGAKKGMKPTNPTGGKLAEKKKKNKEFVGTKSNDTKKALNKNKKKKNKLSNEKLLAKKVAPKLEKTSE